MHKSANNNSKSHIPRLASSRSTSKDRKILMEENNEKPERQKIQELEINNDVLKDGEKALLEFKNNKDKLQKRMEDLKIQFKFLEQNTATLCNAREAQIKNKKNASGDVTEKRSVPNSRESSVERGTRRSPKRRKYLTPNSRYLKTKENQVMRSKKLQENSKKVDLNDTQVIKICNEISASVNSITKSCNIFKNELVSSSDYLSSPSDCCTDLPSVTSESDNVQSAVLQNNKKTPRDTLQNEKQCVTQETERENLQEPTLLDMKQESTQLENQNVTKLEDISSRDVNYYEKENVNCHRNTTTLSLLDMETTILELPGMKKKDHTSDNKLVQELCKSDSGISSMTTDSKENNNNNECQMMDIETNLLETSIISYTGTPAFNKTFISEKTSDIKNNAFYNFHSRDNLYGGSPSYDSDTTKVDMEISDNEDGGSDKTKKSIPLTLSSEQDSEDENIKNLEQIFSKFVNDTEEKIKQIKQHGLKNIKKTTELSNKEETVEENKKKEEVDAKVDEQVVEELVSLEEEHETSDHESKASVAATEAGDVASNTAHNVSSSSMKSSRSASKARVTNNVDTSKSPHHVSVGLGLAAAGGVAAAIYNTYKYWEQVAPLATSLSRYLVLSPSSTSSH